jgi:hypothetical protein
MCWQACWQVLALVLPSTGPGAFDFDDEHDTPAKTRSTNIPITLTVAALCIAKALSWRKRRFGHYRHPTRVRLKAGPWSDGLPIDPEVERARRPDPVLGGHPAVLHELADASTGLAAPRAGPDSPLHENPRPSEINAVARARIGSSRPPG